jgi:hypothetical protein
MPATTLGRAPSGDDDEDSPLSSAPLADQPMDTGHPDIEELRP